MQQVRHHMVTSSNELHNHDNVGFDNYTVWQVICKEKKTHKYPKVTSFTQ